MYNSSVKLVKRAQPDWQGQRGGGVEADLVCQSFGCTLLQWHVWLSWHFAMPRHPPKVHLGNRKWWAISDGTVGTTARVREVLLLTLICWQSVHSWSLVSVPRSVLLKIDQLEFIPLESHKIKNSGWYGENRWLWLFLSSLISVMSIRNNKFIFNVDWFL